MRETGQSGRRDQTTILRNDGTLATPPMYIRPLSISHLNRLSPNLESHGVSLTAAVGNLILHTAPAGTPPYDDGSDKRKLTRMPGRRIHEDLPSSSLSSTRGSRHPARPSLRLFRHLDETLTLPGNYPAVLDDQPSRRTLDRGLNVRLSIDDDKISQRPLG